MPIQLTTSFKVGDFDANNYDIIKVLKFYWDNIEKKIILWAYHGRIVSNRFVAGKKDPTIIEIYNHPAVGLEGDPGYVPPDNQYNDMVSTCVANSNELVYASVQRHLYQWLLAKGYFVGTIV